MIWIKKISERASVLYIDEYEEGVFGVTGMKKGTEHCRIASVKDTYAKIESFARKLGYCGFGCNISLAKAIEKEELAKAGGDICATYVKFHIVRMPLPEFVLSEKQKVCVGALLSDIFRE